MRAQPRALELLDRCADALRRTPGALALLWLTALPARLLLVRFFLVLQHLGAEAPHYRDALQRIANAYLCSWLLSLYGRQLFSRALLRAAFAGADERGPRFRELVRVPLAALAAHSYAAALIELLFWLTLPTYLLPALLAVVAAVSVSAAPAQPRELLGPLSSVLRALAAGWSLCKLSLVAALGFLIALVNLRAFSSLLAWLAGGVAGLDAHALAATLSTENPLYLGLLIAGASLLVEPFWLGMVSLHVDAGRSLESGDDLRRRFAEAVRARAA